MPQYFDSTAAFPMKSKKRVYAKGGRAEYYGGGRTNLYEQLGRVEAEPSNPNRRAEISRVHSELNRGYATGGRVGLKKGGKAKKQGYKDREDESISARRGKESTKKQSFKDRRDESYGKWGKRKRGKINR